MGGFGIPAMVREVLHIVPRANRGQTARRQQRRGRRVPLGARRALRVGWSGNDWSTRLMLLDLIVVGLAIALDPISLTPFLLILASTRGVQKGAAFMLGWLASIAIVIAGTLLVTGSNPPKPSSAPSIAALVVKLLIGIGLIYYAMRQRRKMGQPKPPKKTPKWQTGIDNMSLWFAAILAPLTQPWGLVAAGVTVIIKADLASAQDVVAVVLFALIATSIIITLELYASLRPERAQEFIRRIRSWIGSHSDQVVVILFSVVGLYLVGSSIYYLSTS
jgi:hypothetical protein